MDKKVINIDAEILGGTPVFNGTRVPIKNLFDYLEGGESIETFLDDFEGVTREQVLRVLQFSEKKLNQMELFNIHKAKFNLSFLIKESFERSEDYYREPGEPLVSLYKIESKYSKRVGGQFKGQVWMAKDFDVLPGRFMKYFE